jgi:ubiquinone/menaquinone biosynthesis C-methylase UbiE
LKKAEFDKFADDYDALHAASLGASGEEPAFFSEYKVVDVAREYGRQADVSCQAPRILDFGAGNGASVAPFRKHLPQAHLTCLDVSRRSLDIACARHGQEADYVEFDGNNIPFPPGHFDIAYAACVFHHIDHAKHVSLLRELWRVLRPRGHLFVFEHNPLNPLTVRVVGRCPFDENARLIRASAMRRSLASAGFGGSAIRYRIFFPHLLAALRTLERALTWCPLGAQYYVMGRK